MLRIGSSGALLGVAAALTLAAVPAQAAPPRTIAEYGQGAGKVDLPRGAAVDPSSGDLYVADRNNFRVDRFDSEGNFLLAWGWGVADGKSQELQVCGPAAPSPTPRCFKASVNAANGPGAIAPAAVAVVRESGETFVYVADIDTNRVTKFSPEGEFLYLAGGDVVANGATGTGTLTAGSDLVTGVITTAKVFVVDQPIEGTGIEPGTTIKEVGKGTITLSEPAGPAASGAITPISSPEGLDNVPRNERQTVELGANTTGGTFSLRYNTPNPSPSSAETVAIPYDATASLLEEKLAELENIGVGNVEVSGPAGGPWSVEFKGPRFADTNVNQMSADVSGLTTVSSGKKSAAISSEKGPGEVCESPSECQPASSGSGANEFTRPDSLATDPDGETIWVGDEGRLQELGPDGTPGAEIALPGEGNTQSLATDSAGHFYTARGKENERQRVSLEALASGDAFALEGLPGACSAASTDPISYPDPKKEFVSTLTANIANALAAKCGAGNFGVSVSETPPASTIVFNGSFAQVDQSLLSCAIKSGSGSCSVALLRNGRPASVEKLEVGTGKLLQRFDEGGNPRTVTLDGEDNVYVGECGASTLVCPAYRFMAFDPAGEQVSQFGAGQVIGDPGGNGGANALAVNDDSDTLYAASSRSSEDNSAVQAFDLPQPGPLPGDLRAEEILPTEATLRATLNPEGASTEYRFEYLSEADYIAQGESFEGPATVKTPEPDATLPGTGFDSEEIEAPIEALIPETTYRIRLVGSNENGENAEAGTFTTLPAVGIEAQWASEITARSAKLNAQIDPLGPEANWWLEYGTSPCSEGGCASSSKALLPAGFGETSVAIALSGLSPDTAYHYRFAAEDEREGATYTVHGADRSFTTQPGGLGFDPADSRVWEMVSPRSKFGARIAGADPAQGGQVQAAASGDALAYLSYGSIEANPEGNRLAEQSSALARRGTDGAWASEDITPPHTEVVRFLVGKGLEYRLFSTELEQVLLEPRDVTPLSPYTFERTPYLRHNTTSPVYEPLVTAANVPPGTPPFGGDLLGAVSVRGASGDLDRVILKSAVPLAPGAANGSLYEWSGGALEPVSVLPDDEGGAVVEAQLGSGKASVKGAITEDGSRVFWSASAGSGSFSGLYMRDTVLDATTRLDEVQEGGFGTGAVDPLFLGASADGSVAFFTDSHNLTADANEEGRDLYRCEVVVKEGALDCELTDLSAETENPSDPFESAEVQGLLSGIGADGSRVYFVARGVLDAEPNGEGESASPDQPNLYAWSEVGGVRYVATLAEGDGKDWSDDLLSASVLTATASPSGRYLAFMSELPLTGYDNRDATSGDPAQEVFRYDAKEDELTCVSCNPSGTRPKALRPGAGAGELSNEFDPLTLWEGETVAALLPEATWSEVGGASLYRPRSIHDNGRVFFNAADSLVGADSNGNGDVYQYEPLGVGSCRSSSGDAGTARIPGGCVSLVSSGAAEGTAAFLDASEGGSNVFFYTPAQLSVTDEDHVTDIYDARTNGIKATITPIAECLGEACQPPTQAPTEQTPGSLSFVGPGNLEAKGDCAALSRRSTRLSRKAKRLRRRAAQLTRKSSKPQRSRRLRQRSARLARNARALGKRARRCRRAGARAGR